MSRDNARTPVQWDDSEGAGFTTGRPWIAVNPNASWLNARAQYDRDDSVFAHYRRLIALRHDLPVVAHGGFRRLDGGDPAVFAFERTWGDERLLVIANLSSEARAPRLAAVADAWRDAELLLANRASDPDPHVPLEPWEAKVLVPVR